MGRAASTGMDRWAPAPVSNFRSLPPEWTSAILEPQSPVEPSGVGPTQMRNQLAPTCCCRCCSSLCVVLQRLGEARDRGVSEDQDRRDPAPESLAEPARDRGDGQRGAADVEEVVLWPEVLLDVQALPPHVGDEELLLGDGPA